MKRPHGAAGATIGALVVAMALLGAPIAPAAAADLHSAAPTPPAPPVPVAEGAAFTGIARLDLGGSCTASLVETGVDEAPAYLLTNGHCAGSLGTGPNEVLVDHGASGAATFGLFVDNPEAPESVAVVAVPYSTMKGLDIAVAELAISLGDARALGLAPLAIDPAPPSSGDVVTNVAIPAQGLAPSDWVLRRGRCTLGPPVDLLELVWHFDGSWSNDCPGVRGGSSGSPVLGADGAIVGLINTSTAGADPVGGDCWLNKPCERTKDGAVSVPDRSYAVPVWAAAGCFTRGAFDVGAPDCGLDPGGGPTVRIDERAIRPDPALGAATTSAVVDGPVGIDVIDKVGPAASTDCADPLGYGRPAPLDPPSRVTVEVPAVDGMYVYCVASPDDVERAALAVIQVDSTPPRREPELSVEDLGDVIRVEPIFSIPELSDFVVKIGPAGVTDCADDRGYVRYRRIPFTIDVSELPAVVCLIGFDEAGNAAKPSEQTIDA